MALSYPISSLAKLFASYAKTFSSLDINENQLTLSKHQQLSGLRQKNIPFLKVANNCSIERGWFWDVLQITLVSDEIIKFGGINKKQSGLILQQLNQSLTHYLTKYYQDILPEVQAAQNELETCILTTQYLRYSLMKIWLEKHQPLNDVVLRQDKSSYLSQSQNSLIEQITFTLSAPEFVRKQHNEKLIDRQLVTFKSFFDTIESNLLTPSQRKACVIHDDYNLVLAGAGTGKTSTMIAKAGYLLKAGLAKPENILMLAYGKKAAAEMDERIVDKLGIHNLSVSTFHSFGQQVIAKVEHKKPALSLLATDIIAKEKFISQTIEQLLKDKVYKNKLINYFVRYLYPARNQLDFKTKKAYVAYCTENQLRSLKGDAVKSYEELEIANFLYMQGIAYEYEANYEVDTSGPDYRVYQPDFYLTESKIYLEHFALDHQGNTPLFINQEKYQEGINWKRKLHQEHQTTLLETYSYENRDGVLLINLENKLKAHGVVFNPINQMILFDELKELGQVSIWSKLITDLLAIFKSVFTSIGELMELAKQQTDSVRMVVAIELFQPIYQAYQHVLHQTQTIDFDDMIHKAIKYIETGKYKSPYEHILVDEFQDISASRSQLIKSLMAQNKFNCLFCVGDDWQSIYRFSGSDVSITKNFQDYFGQTAQSVLETTFRFNNKIGDVATKFITQNPHQINKEIQSFKQIDSAAVSIIQTSSDDSGLELALRAITKKVDKKASVLVLARFNFKKPDNFQQIAQHYQNLKIQFMSVHASKGKEADYVIVLGLEKGLNGFPSEKVTHPILNMLLPKTENFKYGEERRLFYVALTRAKHYVYLVSNIQKLSPFIRELKKEDYAVLTDEFNDNCSQKDLLEVSCPDCKEGSLVTRKGPYGDFHACRNYPYCNYNQQPCKKCGSIQRITKHFLICSKEQCQHVTPICPKCNGVMYLRKGPHSQFWGCSNYRQNTDFPCKYTEKYIDLSGALN